MALFDREADDSIVVLDPVILIEVSDGASSLYCVTIDSEENPVSIGEHLGAGLDHVVELGDTVGVTDETLHTDRLVEDGVAVTEQYTFEANYVRSFSETLGALDERQVETDYVRSNEDAVSVTEQWVVEGIYGVNDNVDVTDDLLTETEYVRTASDTLVVEDQTEVGTVFPQDEVTVTDQTTTVTEYVRTAGDLISLTDTILPAAFAIREASDTASVTDSTEADTVFPQDEVEVTEVTSVSTFYNRTRSESGEEILDQILRSVFYDRSLSDSSAVADAAFRGSTRDVVLEDTVVVTDTAADQIIKDREVSDTISIADSLLRATDTRRQLSDTITVSETLVRSLTAERAVADSAATADSIERDLTRGRTLNEAVGVTDSLEKVVDYRRSVSDEIVLTESLVTTLLQIFQIEIDDSVSISEFLLVETVNIDVEVHDALFLGEDDVLRETNLDRTFSETIGVTDFASGERGGVVDRFADESIAVTDEAAYVQDVNEILADEVGAFDATAINLFSDVQIEADAGGFAITFTPTVELRYDRVLDTSLYSFRPILGGVPFQVETVEPIVDVQQEGGSGTIVDQGSPNFVSNRFRVSGSDPSSSSSVEPGEILATETFSVSDTFVVEVLGPSSTFRFDGFAGSSGQYIEILNGRAPGIYRIVNVHDALTVDLDRPLPLVDPQNGSLQWRFTSAIKQLRFHTASKVTNQANYDFHLKGLLDRNGDPYEFRTKFFTSGISGPRVDSVDVTDEGVVVVLYDQPMTADRDLVRPEEYRITGPTDVMIQRAWTFDESSVALETIGLDVGSYLLSVNYSGTPKDLAGNPIDPDFSEAVFNGVSPLSPRSIFTDKGPIAKPPLTLQRGSGATIVAISEVTLSGASLTSDHIGLYVRLGPLGLPPTTSSVVVGSDVAIVDTVSVPDSYKVEILGLNPTVSSSTSGTFKILGVLSPTRARLQASFTIPDLSGGLYWEVFDPRNGEVADSPSDVTVRINGVQVVPDAVVGLLGQVVLPEVPSPTDDVKVDYSWCCNPTVEFRRLNSKEFRLNNGAGFGPTQHKYRYDNVLVRPSDYEPLNMLATIGQPELREIHYRAYERAYTPVLNDPSTLILNSPIHKIAFPPAQRELSEVFVTYEATVLPENDTNPWLRKGSGMASVLAGVLTVVDNTTGPFPAGSPIFWTKSLDLTFPHAFALSWRFEVTSVPVYDGIFSGIAAGYTDESAAYIVGFLEVGGVRKVGFLKRGAADDPSLTTSWIGGVDGDGNPTGGPVDLDWSLLRSYRIFRDRNGVVRFFVDGDVVETLRILPNEAPFLEDLNAPFDEIQGVFFGSVSRVAENESRWDFVRYLILPTNALQSSSSSFVNYEATLPPEQDVKPWTPIGFHGTETLLSGSLLLDSTSATDAATAIQVGLIGGDYRGYVRMEPLLSSSSQVVVDVSAQLRTHTHGVDPYGLMFAVDDGTFLIQTAFFPDRATPKFSYGGRSFPEDFSPYVWSALGGATAAMVGRILRITDTSVSDGKVYFIEDTAPPLSDDRVVASGIDYMLEFRNKVLSFTEDVSGFAGIFGQVFDGTRAVGVMFQVVSGTKYVAFHSDGVPLGSSARFAFDWSDGAFHTYRFSKSTAGDLVTLFIDGEFVGSVSYSSFTVLPPDNGIVSFGSSTAASSGALSVVDWAYCNVWRLRSDLKHYVGIWKGFDSDSLTGYHMPLKASGRNAQISGNALGDDQATFLTANVVTGDRLVVDTGPNKGVYEVAAVSSQTTLTIVGTWLLGPTLTDYRIVKETDWTIQHKYRLTRDPSGEVSLLFESDEDPLIRVGYNSIDLPNSGTGIIKTLSNGLAAIAFGSFSPENLEQSNWDFFRYGITRSPADPRIAPHHQVLNQWNVVESPERLFTSIPHELTSFKSSSTGIVPKKDPDFLKDQGLLAYTQLNDSTPLVPSTQSFEVRGPFPTQEIVAGLNSPENVLNNDGNFVLNDGTVRFKLVVPNDVLYSALDVIEQTVGEPSLIAPFGDDCGPSFSGFEYTKETCLTYTADVLPENDSLSPTPWARESDNPAQVSASVLGGILTFGTTGSATVYKNHTPLPDAPGLKTEAKFRLKLTNDATFGTGDSQVRFGLSAPGLTVSLAFVTTPLAERYVLVMDQNSGRHLGSVSFDFLDGNFHDYRIVRDPGAGVVRIFIDS